MRLENYTTVVLLTDKYESEGVKTGDIGTIIEVYNDAYEVDFSDANGITITMIVLQEDEVKAASTGEKGWTLDDLRAKRAEIIALAERHGAKNVRVFGSVARGEADKSSDVDLIVSTEPNANVFEMVGLWQALQDLLQSDVSLITDGIEDKDYLQRIANEWILL
jgi:uncharacterized protein